VRRSVAATAAILAAVALGVAAIPSLGAAKPPRLVAVKDDVFGPKYMAVKKGRTVRWVWKGKSRHNVTVVTGPKKFRSGNRKKGGWPHTFKTKGTYRIVCTIHAPDMNMTVKVK
jgi:plastocyanin